MNDAGTHAPQGPTLAQGVITLLVVIVVIAIYLVAAFKLELTQAHLGFFFLLYWSGVDQANRARLLPDALGALVGLGLASALYALLHGSDPATGGLIFLAISIVLMFVSIMNWLPMLINLSTWLILTVGAYPVVLEKGDFFEMAKGLAFGIVYFSVIVSALMFLNEAMNKKKPAIAPA
jgi:hypothetical protein